MEAYLDCYCNYEQNDWASMLAMAGYVYNNSNHLAEKKSQLFANYG